MIYGYARVSTVKQEKGNSLEEQERELKANNVEKIYKDSFTGTKVDRPAFNELLDIVEPNDTIIITKLDRFARNTIDGVTTIRGLIDRGIKVYILNMGLVDNTPTGRLILTVMLAFAEFERDMIVQRTQEGKAIAKLKPGFKDGRPKKYTVQQLDLAMVLLKDHSFSQVSEMTGISKSTLTREARKRKAA